MAVLKRNPTSIFWMVLFLSLVLGVLFFLFREQWDHLRLQVLISGLPFWLFVLGVFGLLWPEIKPKGESNYIIHSLAIGVAFLILFLIHVWIILPLFCPDFNPGCGF